MYALRSNVPLGARLRGENEVAGSAKEADKSEGQTGGVEGVDVAICSAAGASPETGCSPEN